MEKIEKKVWETPALKDLNVKETEGGVYNGTVEGTSYSPSGVGGI